jgi:hypothetical protein
MRMKYMMILAGIFVLASYAMAAPDCETSKPLLPETFDGLPRSGQPGVRSFEDGSCTASQRYLSKDYARAAIITVAKGERSRDALSYEIMSALAGEKDSSVTWETISDQKTVLHLDKKGKKGTLYFSPRKEVQMILEVDPVDSKEEMLRLGELLPLAKLAEAK